KILVALVGNLDRPTTLLRQQNGRRFRHSGDFATKTATDLRRYNAYLGLWHPKNPRQTVAQREAPLRGRPHRATTGRLDIGHGGTWFNIRLVRHGDVEAVFKDIIGLRKTLLDIAPLHAPA